MLRRAEADRLMAQPLRVLIDARMLIGRFSGVARVVTRLVDELTRRGDVKVMALCGHEPFDPWKGRGNLDIIASSFGRRDRTPTRRYLWEETHLRRIIRRSGADVFHATWNTGMPARCPVPVVLTVHDLIPWRNPADHFATAAQRFFYRRAVRSSIRRADRVTTVSEYVRGQVLDTFAVDRAKVVTVYNGVDVPRRVEDVRSEAMAQPGERPYVLYVGGHERRKNVAAVLASLQQYWRRFDAGLELRLTGESGSLCPDARRALEQLSSNAPVRFLGSPNDQELSRFYAGAAALLMLSHDEGFGLPALEAMAHGCPVIAANRASLPEVVGDAGLLVEPERIDDVAEAIRRLISDDTRRGDLVQRGRVRARGFSWAATAEGMLAAYDAALRRTHLPTSLPLIPPATTQTYGAMPAPDC